jgi:fatty-acyl-CoA synthase
VEVLVTEDKIHGSMATIAVKAAADVTPQQIEQKIDDILSRYTVRYQIVFK